MLRLVAVREGDVREVDVERRLRLQHGVRSLESRAERDGAVLSLQPLAELRELLADRRDRRLAVTPEEKARMEHDELGSRGLGDPRGVVEHPDGHALLLVTLEVAHETGNRRMHREDDLGLAGELSESRRPRVIHPEAALEVDLAGREAALLENPNR